MPEITIRITVPEGATVEVEREESSTTTAPAGPEEDGTEDEPSPPTNEDIEPYWSRLSDNGREYYRAAAEIERRQGTFTMHEVAELIGREVESARSMHRSTGRTARKWREDMHRDPPIEILSYEEYDPAKGYGVYTLPEGVAGAIKTL